MAYTKTRSYGGKSKSNSKKHERPTKAVLSPNFSPSVYQYDILDFVQNGLGHGAVSAVPGSGKTTTVTWLTDYVSEALTICFNAPIRDELLKRTSERIDCQTCHSQGFRALRENYLNGGRINVDSWKYKNLIEETWDSRISNSEALRKYKSDLEKLIKFRIVNCADTPDDLEDTIAEYGLDVDTSISTDQYFDHVEEILDLGKQLLKQNIVSFDDMIHFPRILNLPLQKSKWVFGDESQDFSKAQLWIVLNSLKSDGRLLAVGDPYQSMYGFAGANVGSFQHIVDTTQAQLLPLSISYRCPRSHVELAKRINPAIEARDDAPEGIINTIRRSQMKLAVGDMVMCRVTAPLISLCIELIKDRQPAVVKGRDIAGQLTRIVKDVANFPGFRYIEFQPALEDYYDREVAKLQKYKNADSRIQALTDRIEGVRACYEGFTECTTAQCLVTGIESIFSDDEKARINLMTVHRAKGLEANRTFILKPEKMPLCWPNQQDWELQQEWNIKYVAETRSLNELNFIED